MRRVRNILRKLLRGLKTAVKGSKDRKPFSITTLITILSAALVGIISLTCISIFRSENNTIAFNEKTENDVFSVPAAVNSTVPVSYVLVTPLPSEGETAETDPVYSFTLTVGGSVHIVESMKESIDEEELSDIDYALHSDENLFFLDVSTQNEEIPVIDPKILQEMKKIGFDTALSYSVLGDDYGYDDLNGVNDIIRDAGIGCICINKDTEDHSRISGLNGVSVAVFAYPMTAEELLSESHAEIERLRNEIAGARNAGAKFVTVFVYWQDDESREITEHEKSLVKTICSLGADMVIGSKEGCVTAPEWIDVRDSMSGDQRRALAVYSVGSLVSPISDDITSAAGYLLNVEITQRGDECEFSEIRYIPFCTSVQTDYRVIICDLSLPESLNEQQKAFVHDCAVYISDMMQDSPAVIYDFR